MSETLIPGSPRWTEFTNRLADIVFDDPITARCDGDDPLFVHRYATQVMREMGGINVIETLAYFREHGGYCDCEILFNVGSP